VVNVCLNGAQFRAAGHAPEIIPLQDLLPYGLPLQHLDVQRLPPTTAINAKEKRILLGDTTLRLTPAKIAIRVRNARGHLAAAAYGFSPMPLSLIHPSSNAIQSFSSQLRPDGREGVPKTVRS
jgi:hypothetical protein